MTKRNGLSLLALLLAAPLARAGEISWAKDFDAAKKSAESSKKLIMIDFWREN